MTFVIRPMERADIPRVFPVLHRANPCRVVSEEAMLWRADHPTPKFEDTDLIAVEPDGEVVGYIRSRLALQDGRPGRGYTVLASFADASSASDLMTGFLAASERNLVRSGATGLRAEAAAESIQVGGVRFGNLLVDHGYEPAENAHILGLDMSGLPDAPAAPQGVELRPFVEFSDDPRPLYEIDRQASGDEPGEGNEEGFMSFEEWRENVWPHPLNDLDLSLAVLVDGVPVGITQYSSDGGVRMESEMTGTLREYRGRGLAGYAKTAALHRARERGVKWAYTGNHADNAPMLAINDRLGYTLAGIETTYQKPIGDAVDAGLSG